MFYYLKFHILKELISNAESLASLRTMKDLNQEVMLQIRRKYSKSALQTINKLNRLDSPLDHGVSSIYERKMLFHTDLRPVYSDNLQGNS